MFRTVLHVSKRNSYTQKCFGNTNESYNFIFIYFSHVSHELS
jgi:hypothetical protein